MPIVKSKKLLKFFFLLRYNLLAFQFAASIASCKNPTQAKSSSFTEIEKSDKPKPDSSSSPKPNEKDGPYSDSKMSNSNFGGGACTPSEMHAMTEQIPNNCYYMRRVPEKGKEVLLDGKCIKQEEKILVGQKTGEFFTVCYRNIRGFMHESAFKK